MDTTRGYTMDTTHGYLMLSVRQADHMRSHPKLRPV